MHLIDPLMPAIAYVVRFLAADKDCRPGYRQARGDILRLLEESEAAARAAGLPADDYDQARFVVCAWIDETLLASDWNEKLYWQHEQLQRIYYNTTDAGVEAFDRLEAIAPERRDIREVYCLCLLLGFRGRYIGKEDPLHLEQLKAANLKLLAAGPADGLSLEHIELFPGALSDRVPDEGVRGAAGFAIDSTTAVLIATPLILFALLYLVYRYVLNGLVLPIL